MHTSIQEVQKYVEARPDQFDGLYVAGTGSPCPDGPGDGRLRPRRARGPPGHPIDGIRPSVAASRVQLTRVAHSTAELETVKFRITTVRPWATGIKGLLMSWSMHSSTNKVLVQLSRVPKADQRRGTMTSGPTADPPAMTASTSKSVSSLSSASAVISSRLVWSRPARA